MITKCKFNPERDIQETIPDLAMSIHMALTTGVVKDTADSTPYTKLKSIEEVGNYLHDPIDIAMAAKKLGKAMSNLNPTSTEMSSGNPE